MKRKYEQLNLLPISVSTEESVLYASGEQTDCEVRIIKAEVDGFGAGTNDWKELTFDATLDANR